MEEIDNQDTTEDYDRIGTVTNDYIPGSSEDEVFFGDLGNDLFVGGGGADKFVFQNVTSQEFLEDGTSYMVVSDHGEDLILDFTEGEDIIIDLAEGKDVITGNPDANQVKSLKDGIRQ